MRLRVGVHRGELAAPLLGVYAMDIHIWSEDGDHINVDGYGTMMNKVSDELTLLSLLKTMVTKLEAGQ